MEAFLLGSGGMMPMPGRRLTSVLVRTDRQDYLLDAGEGVQISFKELSLGIKRLAVVAISHLHADHCLGLPGLMMLRAQVDEPGPLTLIGPRGLNRFVSNVIRDLRCHIGYPYEVHELDPISESHGEALRLPELSITWARLDHSVPCVGYRLQEHERPGRFYPERAIALGVPEGPMWGMLQRGREVTLPDGKKILPGQVMGAERRGRSIAYATDTRPCAGVERLIQGADLAFVEGMFLDDAADLAKEKGHMTVEEAALLASKAGVSSLVLVHLSPRYHNGQRSDLVKCARRTFAQAVVGRDLQSFQVSFPEDPPAAFKDDLESPMPP